MGVMINVCILRVLFGVNDFFWFFFVVLVNRYCRLFLLSMIRRRYVHMHQIARARRAVVSG
jgi:hypothetical protein